MFVKKYLKTKFQLLKKYILVESSDNRYIYSSLQLDILHFVSIQ